MRREGIVVSKHLFHSTVIAAVCLTGLSLGACGADPGGGAATTAASGGATAGQTSPVTPAGEASSTTASGEVWDVVVFADSSGWGLAERLADRIEQDLGVQTNPIDFATGAYLGYKLLEELRTEGNARRQAARDGEVIVVWVNPLSIGWTTDLDRCVMQRTGTAPPVRLAPEDFEPYPQLWRDVLSEVIALREGQPTAIRVRDIWDAALADHRAAGTAEGCTAGWETMSGIARDVAAEFGVPFVSFYDAFNGPDHTLDPIAAGLLLDDREHANDAGRDLLADLLHEVGYAELTG